MKRPTKFLTGLLAATLAWQVAYCPAARAAEFTLARAEGDGKIELQPSSPATASGSIQLEQRTDWSDLAYPANPDPYKAMELGHLREGMSTAHFLLGATTLGLLAGAGLSGLMLVQQNDPNMRLAHQWMVGLGTTTYMADGALMLFAPHPYKGKGEEHLSNVKLHKYLFWLHCAGMASAVTTGLIATRFWGLDPNNDIRRTHPAIGGTAIGLIGLSAVVMALNF